MGFVCVLCGACRPSASVSPATVSIPVAPIETTPILQAFERLAQDTFWLSRTLAMLDSSGRLLGQEVRVGFYHPDSGLQWLHIDRKGQFPEGFFYPKVRGAEHAPLAAVQPLWPDPLPFLQPRQRDAYRFQPLPDTSLHGQPVTRLFVGPAHPTHATSGTFQGVLYLDAQRLVGAELQESHATLFSSEHRYVSIWLHPADGRLRQEQFLLELNALGMPTYRFCLETRYAYADRVSVDPRSMFLGFCRLPFFKPIGL